MFTKRLPYLHPEELHDCCRYFDFVNFNTTGYRPYVTTLYAVLLGCLRKSISRILVLIVSMGFGVVLPYLGAIQHKVGIITGKRVRHPGHFIMHCLAPSERPQRSRVDCATGP